MRRLFLFAAALVAYLTCNAQSGQLATLFPESTLDGILSTCDQFKPVPNAADSWWQTNLPATTRDNIIAQGRNTKARGVSWGQIPDSLFAQYFITGNRTNYENVRSRRNSDFYYLVMAEIMEHKGNYIDDIINGLNFFKEQVWWGVPAHYGQQTLSRERQVVDLFNAETGRRIAWALYMLGDELNAASPGIVDAMKKEVQRRLIEPMINNNYSWMSTTSNWNTWISESMLSCVMFCSADRNQQLKCFEKIMRDLDQFAIKYPHDGGCTEGTMYWNVAAGSYYNCCQLMYLATNGQIDLSRDELLHNLAKYIYNMHISSNYYVNYADAPPTLNVQFQILFNYGQFVGDTIMTQMGAQLAKNCNYFSRPAQNCSGWLSRELMFLNQYNAVNTATAHEALVTDSWYPDIQQMTARSINGSDEGLFLSAKAGNNDELHNHNDVGNFIVYYNGHPMVIDIGFATYTAQSFSGQRYELLNMRSLYHNVPYINGCEQKDGAAYKATLVRYSKNGSIVSFSQDIAKAYPSEAGVGSWIRNITFDRNQIRFTETYSLSKYTQAPEISIVVAKLPIISTPGRVTLRSNGGSCYLRYDTAAVSVSRQAVSLSGLDASSEWGSTIYKLILKPKSTATNGQVVYTIAPVEALDTHPVPLAMTLDRHSATLDYDNISTQLQANFIPSDASSLLTWTSSDADVAVVSSEGVVTGLRSGVATISCVTAEGKRDTCVVRVADGIVSIDPIGDTYASGASPTTNYGGESTLLVKKGDASSDMAAYFLFPLSGQLPAGTTTASNIKARLSLYVMSVGTGIDGLTWNVYPLSGIRWNENTLTYNTARSLSPTLSNLLAAVDERNVSDTLLNNRVDFDVTAYTKTRLGSTRVAYYLTQNINSGTGDNTSEFYSSNYSDPTVKPRLVVHLLDLVDDIHAATADAVPTAVSVYSADGVLLRRNASPARATEGLAPGIYIVGKRKALVK